MGACNIALRILGGFTLVTWILLIFVTPYITLSFIFKDHAQRQTSLTKKAPQSDLGTSLFLNTPENLFTAGALIGVMLTQFICATGIAIGTRLVSTKLTEKNYKLRGDKFLVGCWILFHLGIPFLFAITPFRRVDIFLAFVGVFLVFVAIKLPKVPTPESG